ncbi:hypothetical protein G4H71_16820 [Rhodococcus triatomae]|uniref:Modulator of FtsH protease n=1 Tax=Rhodococcus triatomae TaxID=300028 RepID=A0A1G8R9W3_9NOCA|nr:hypothetical protein [Rhodococcus triatomae]QNG19607.1 hypothetical protein G4H72_13555 [Rhodococcus triatomae]QNG24478.1 hypothetical protein G4H71_16820 [Rhodococcus triatomae]SDJ13325.1 hypothetical protein SAMN05444695_11741 [Rhodococcus triatomae]
MQALDAWSEFNVAVAGAGAALAGLLIVAMSVNIERILQAVTLPSRAAASIGALVLSVTASCLALVPGQSATLLGFEVAAGVLVLWALEYVAIRSILREPGQPSVLRVPKIAVGALAPAAFSVGAIVLITGSPDGYYWVAAGSVLAVMSGVLFSWIALVEILR